MFTTNNSNNSFTETSTSLLERRQQTAPFLHSLELPSLSSLTKVLMTEDPKKAREEEESLPHSPNTQAATKAALEAATAVTASMITSTAQPLIQHQHDPFLSNPSNSTTTSTTDTNSSSADSMVNNSNSDTNTDTISTISTAANAIASNLLYRGFTSNNIHHHTSPSSHLDTPTAVAQSSSSSSSSSSINGNNNNNNGNITTATATDNTLLSNMSDATVIAAAAAAAATSVGLFPSHNTTATVANPAIHSTTTQSLLTTSNPLDQALLSHNGFINPHHQQQHLFHPMTATGLTDPQLIHPASTTTAVAAATTIGMAPTLMDRERQLSISSSTSIDNKAYSFVAIPGTNQRKRPRRRYDEIERLYHCNWPGCTKAYGTLNHLNAHVSMQQHGPKRHPSEFKEMRKEWRRQKKEREAAKKAAEAAYRNQQQQQQQQQQQHHHLLHQQQQSYPFSAQLSNPFMPNNMSLW